MRHVVKAVENDVENLVKAHLGSKEIEALWTALTAGNFVFSQ